MGPIMPGEGDTSYMPSSIRELMTFWKYLYKNGRMIRILIYIALSLLLLLLLTLLVQGTLDEVLGPNTFPVFVLPLLVLVMFILYSPTLPRLYRYQFQGKFRPEITEDALHGLLMELVGKSLEMVSMMIGLICAFCIVVFEAGKFFSLPDNIMLTLLAITAIDTFLTTLLFSTLGRYNRDFLSRTFSEEEYKRYTSLGNYRNLLIALFAINVLAVILLLYGLFSSLT
jgi:hypothetical protein